MNDALTANFVDPDKVRKYLEHGPPAFAPGHAGMLQMIGILLGERMPEDGTVLVVGAGGGWRSGIWRESLRRGASSGSTPRPRCSISRA